MYLKRKFIRKFIKIITFLIKIISFLIALILLFVSLCNVKRRKPQKTAIMPFSFTHIAQSLYPKQENLAWVGSEYAQLLKVPLTNLTLQTTLEEHPDYPSLLSLSDAFDTFKIENAAIQIDAEQLETLPPPYIAHLKNDGGSFVLVQNATKSTFVYANENGKQSASQADFLKNWDGVAFIAEPNEQSGEANYKTKHQAETLEALRWPLVGLGFMLFVAVGVWQAPTLAVSVWVLLKAIGVVLSVMLLSVQFGQANNLTASLCKLNNKTNCNNILNSPAAKLTNWLSWSEVGLFYFVGGLLVLSPLNPPVGDLNTVLLPLWGLGGLALPYTFWSVYYQWRVAKQWCPLCLCVLAVLWLEAITGLWVISPLNPPVGDLNTVLKFSLWGGAMFRLGGYFSLLSLFSFPSFLYLIIKPLILKASQTDQLKKDIRRFRNNPAIFEALLQQQPAMPALPADLQPIVLGNPEAKHTLVMVTNPYCGPCATAHQQLEQALAANSNLNANIVFTATNHPNDKRGPIARHLLALNGINQKEALTTWYAQAIKNYDTWAEQYPIDNTNENQLQKHKRWCEQANIEATPTFFVDGFALPQPYQIADVGRLLKYSTLNMDLAESK